MWHIELFLNSIQVVWFNNAINLLWPSWHFANIPRKCLPHTAEKAGVISKYITQEIRNRFSHTKEISFTWQGCKYNSKACSASPPNITLCSPWLIICVPNVPIAGLDLSVATHYLPSGNLISHFQTTKGIVLFVGLEVLTAVFMKNSPLENNAV